jgi:hypothetical protein
VGSPEGLRYVVLHEISFVVTAAAFGLHRVAACVQRGRDSIRRFTSECVGIS